MSTQVDMEGGRDEADTSYFPPRGYPLVATAMSQFPASAFVRRFKGLNARNLLYLQAELSLIEKELLDCEARDAKATATELKSNYSRDYKFLAESADKEDNRQWVLIQRMREKLKEYNDVLIQQTTLAEIPRPSDFNIKAMQAWFTRAELGDIPISSSDGQIWLESSENHSSQNPDDLIAIDRNAAKAVDPFTTWLLNHITLFWDANISRHLNHSETAFKYSVSAIYSTVSVINTVISSLFLVVGIVILYFVDSRPKRLGVVAALTAMLSLSLALLSRDTRGTNFAATSAFAAVQVVFIGTSGNDTSAG